MNLVYIATSLDGYIAREDGGIDWLTEIPAPAGGGDYGYAEFMARVDCVLMGRATFESVLGFPEWPYQKPVFVLSRGQKPLPAGLERKAEIVTGPVPTLVRGLAARGFRDIYVDGGMTIRSFLAEDLIDEMTITRVPLLLGAGRPLFGPLAQALSFEHAGTETFSNGLVKSRYVRKRRA